MSKLSVFIIAFVIFAFIGCKSSTEQTNHQTHSNTNPTKTETDTADKGFRAELKTEPAAIAANQPVKLTLTVKDKNGATFKDLQIVHEKPMHLIAVSEDLAEFYHLHPELQTDGSLTANFTFPAGGKYYFYADYTPKGANQIVDRLPVEISGAEREKEILKPDANQEKTVGGVRVSLKSDAEIESNKELMLNFSLTDAATNKPVEDLENYLGKKAHFVVISKDLRDFVHAHPVSMDDTKSKMTQNAVLPPVSAHVTFPNATVYKIFVEIKRAGKVIAIPFTVDVKQGKTDKTLTEANIPAGYYKIVVSRDGFTPSEVTLSGNDGGKLAFLRVDEENCGDEIVFKDLNIKKKLPVGEVVLVELPKDKKGEFNFSCGMDMLKGKIIIQ